MRTDRFETLAYIEQRAFAWAWMLTWAYVMTNR